MKLHTVLCIIAAIVVALMVFAPETEARIPRRKLQALKKAGLVLLLLKERRRFSSLCLCLCHFLFREYCLSLSLLIFSCLCLTMNVSPQTEWSTSTLLNPSPSQLPSLSPLPSLNTNHPTEETTLPQTATQLPLHTEVKNTEEPNSMDLLPTK